MSKPTIQENTLEHGHLQAVIWQDSDEAPEPALVLRTHSVGVIGLMQEGDEILIDPSTDAEILDWLSKLAARPGAWLRLSFSNSKDMGYRKNFLSLNMREEAGWVTGNSVREVLGKKMTETGWRRPRTRKANLATKEAK